MTSQPAQVEQPARNQARMLAVVAVAAVLGLTSLWLPALSIELGTASTTGNFFGAAGPWAPVLAAIFGATVICAGLGTALRAEWARVLAGVLGVLSGAIGGAVVVNVSTLILFGGGATNFVPRVVGVGVGNVALGAVSVVLFVASVLALDAQE